MGGVPTSGLGTVTGHSIKWTGLFGASCSYGFGVSISAAGGLPRNDGDITFFMNDVACTEWGAKGAIWKDCGASRRTKMIGEPDAGNPHVRFDEGRQETCVRVARLSP